ncbi:MAG: prenyltransferase/squalene oxidase repeat-containing protein [Thermoleophilia bacterium]
MCRKTWLALALACLAALPLAVSATASGARAATDPRPGTVTKGLDYLHGRQTTTGGFGTLSATNWGVLGLVASGERASSTVWAVGGKKPYDYLQSTSHDAAATAADVDNAPVYYAQAIMAYVAADRAERVFIAGTPRVDLLAKLYGYQDMTDVSPTLGSFSPSSSSRDFQAVDTTAWAIFAMHAIGDDEKDRFRLAITWLAAQQNDNGGFPGQAGQASNVEDTALAIQALELAGGTPIGAGTIPDARTYLKAAQRSDGGFPYQPGGTTDAEATAAAIQAVVAMGEHQSDAFWKVGINTPAHALGLLQKDNGSYAKKSGSSLRPLPTTSWALIALRGRPFTTYPRSIGQAIKGFVFRPSLRTIAPRNGTTFTATRVVLIRATYTDGSKGTGVKRTACRVYLDGSDRTKSAVIGRYGLQLQLKDVPNGTHTYKLQIVDQAGNVLQAQRSFKVNVPLPPNATPTPTPGPTYQTPAPIIPTITPRPTVTPYPTPSVTLTPLPYSTATPSPYPSGSTVTGAPVASPSPSPPGGAAVVDDGGNAAGFLGGTLLAMLPLGAVISYLAWQRRARALQEASAGKILTSGGSAWERAHRALARSKDIIKPAGS